MMYDDELYHHGILGMKWGVRRYQNADGSYTEAGKKRYGNMSSEEAQADMDERATKIDKRAKAAAIALVSAAAVIGVGALVYKNSDTVQRFVKDTKNYGIKRMATILPAAGFVGKTDEATGYVDNSQTPDMDAYKKGLEMLKKKGLKDDALTWYTDEGAHEVAKMKYDQYKNAMGSDKKKLGDLASKIPVVKDLTAKKAPAEWQQVMLDKAAGKAVSEDAYNEAVKEAKRVEYAKKQAKAYRDANNVGGRVSEFVDGIDVLPQGVKDVAKGAATAGVAGAVTAGLNRLHEKNVEKKLASGKTDGITTEEIQKYNTAKSAEQQYKRGATDSGNYKEVLSNPENYSSDEIEAALRRASALERAKNYQG